MASSGMISCICWVPKGAAKPVPEAAPVSEEELAAMRAEAQAVAAGVLGESGEEEDDEPSDDWETEDEEMDEQEAVAKAKAVAAALAASSSKGGSGGKTVRRAGRRDH
jgi:periodic tryptophan protein 1